MYIKHFLKSTSFFKFLFFIVFLSEGLVKNPSPQGLSPLHLSLRCTPSRTSFRVFFQKFLFWRKFLFQKSMLLFTKKWIFLEIFGKLFFSEFFLRKSNAFEGRLKACRKRPIIGIFPEQNNAMTTCFFIFLFSIIFILIYMSTMPAARKSKNMPQNFYPCTNP